MNLTDIQLPPAIDKEDVCPAIYTGQRLADRDPVKYGQIVQSLASGMPVTRIARTFKVAPETVPKAKHLETNTCKFTSKRSASKNQNQPASHSLSIK